MRESQNDQKTSFQQDSLQRPMLKDNEIDLRELFGVIWDSKLLIVGITGLFAALAIVFALLQPNIYRSEALLAPVQAGDSASSLASKFGGLASLAGVNLPAGGIDKTSLAIEYIQSRVFLKKFIQNHPGVLPALMAVDKWHGGNNILEFDTNVYDVDTGEWVREAVAPRKSVPSVQEAHEVFKQLLSISRDKDSSFVTLAIEHQSPYVAAQWVTWLIEDVNNALRDNDIAQAERSIAYLQSEINNTSISEMRSSLFELIQSQTQTIMLANASPEYIFKTVDPAVVPEIKTKPSRALIVVLGALLGGFLAVSIVFIRQFSKKDDTAD